MIISRTDPFTIDWKDSDGRGVTSVLRGVGGAVAGTWKATCGAVTACTAGLGLFNSYEKYKSMHQAWNQYNQMVNYLNQHYPEKINGSPTGNTGEEFWPQSIKDFMNSWYNSLVSQFGNTVSTCVQSVPGMPSSGTVSNPLR